MTDELTLTSPRPGRTMTAIVRPWWQRYQQVVGKAQSMLTPDLARDIGCGLDLHEGPVVEDSTQRVARVIAALWLVSENLRARTPRSSYDLLDEVAADAEGLQAVLEAITRIPAARELAAEDELLEMLPYMLDPHGEGTRLSVLRDSTQARHREARKRGGVYLTPGDLATYMVSRLQTALVSEKEPTSLLDLACGTGVFLRTALRRMAAFGIAPEAAVSALYGIDISPEAVDACRTVLFAEVLSTGTPDMSQVYWSRIRGQLAVADTLQLVDCRTSSDVDCPGACRWPDSWPQRFSAVIGNPPYAPMGASVPSESISRTLTSLDGATPSTNAYLPFLEAVGLLTEQDGVACVVVPMSIAYSMTRPARSVRAALQSMGGRLEFAFFDRTPDALFGDDVKQRSAIVFLCRAVQDEVFTSPVLRWTSRSRHRLFSSVPAVSLGGDSIVDGIPKLGSELQRAAYGQLRSIHCALGSEVKLQRQPVDYPLDGTCLMVTSTAYNWLTVYRTVPWMSETDRATTTPATVIACQSVLHADATYALLCSKLVYWLWRVTGDGFHVPSRFISSLPGLSCMPDHAVEDLAEAGRKLWAFVREDPIRSINRGRTTVTYAPWSAWDTVSTIDELLMRALGLEPELTRELSALVEDNVIVDPSDRTRTGRRSQVQQWRIA